MSISLSPPLRAVGRNTLLRYASRTGAAVRGKIFMDSHAALVFGREDSGLTNEELAWLTFLLVCRWWRIILRSIWAGGDGLLLSISNINTTTGEKDTTADQHQLQALRERAMTLLRLWQWQMT